MQGGPLRELARMLGFTPGEYTADIEPIRQDTPQYWPRADVTLQQGDVVEKIIQILGW